MEKHLGKIAEVNFGYCGYQGQMLGISFLIETSGGSCAVDECVWDPNLTECSERSKWSESDRDKKLMEIMRYISDLLHKAKVKDIMDLKGMPIEAEFENMRIKSFRILEEVL